MLRAYWRLVNRGTIQISKRLVWAILAVGAFMFVAMMISLALKGGPSHVGGPRL
jgi:hypothetical protein